MQDKEKDSTEEEKKEDSNVAFFHLLYKMLLDNEIEETYANQLVEELDGSVKPDMPIDYLLSVVYQKMVLKFGQTKTIQSAEKGSKLVYFIGPTGVGKTTTIAKIASRLSVVEKKKIVLLTADTYRIAAAEQLRTYANILEVPFRIIYTPQEIRTAIEDYAAYDYIFVDTSGHSQKNTDQRDDTLALLRAADGQAEKEVYLVVSATTKYRDLLNIADTYQKLTDFRLVFTKLDETQCQGNLFNLRLHTDAPMSYVTCGQNVPDDIGEFDAQKTVKLLLGGQSVRVKEGDRLDQASQLRNIIKMNQERPRPLARVITVTSGKGGVGKSNTSINLAIQLKKLGQRVVILDADFGLANIEIMFGAVPQFNLSDLIYKGKDITEIITWGPGGIGFYLGWFRYCGTF